MRYGIYRNSEGYSDPTAGVAMSNILRDERKKRRKASRQHKRQPRMTQQKKTAVMVKEVSPSDG